MINIGKHVMCSEHGTTAVCYVQPRGKHIDSAECICLYRPNAGHPKVDCPVISHRNVARKRVNGPADSEPPRHQDTKKGEGGG